MTRKYSILQYNYAAILGHYVVANTRNIISESSPPSEVSGEEAAAGPGLGISDSEEKAETGPDPRPGDLLQCCSYTEQRNFAVVTI